MTDANQFARDHGSEALRRYMDEAPAEPMNGHAVDMGPQPPPHDLAVAPKFPPIAIDDIEPAAEPAWCVQGLLPARGLTPFIGSPGAGKSFLLADMLFHVARGVPYAGRETLQGPVIYLVGEGVTGFRRRMKAMRRHHDAEGQRVPFFVIETVPDLGSEQTDVAVLLAELDAFIAASALPRPRAIALDTLARCMGNGDENATRDMGRFVARCGMIERHFGCVVAPVHHFGKDKDRGSRGSNSLDGAADVMTEVEKFEGWNRARITKMKDGAEGQEWRFRLVPYELEDDPKAENVALCCAAAEKWTCTVEILSEPARPQHRATKKPPRPPRGVAGDLLKVIRHAIDEAGDASIVGKDAPQGARAVSRDMLKKYCATMGWQQDKADNSFRAVLSGNLSVLRSADVIGFDGAAVWMTAP
jgi:hypothetical protein